MGWFERAGGLTVKLVCEEKEYGATSRSLRCVVAIGIEQMVVGTLQL